MGAINPNVAWTKVDVLTSSQRLAAEIQVRGRLRETMNDPESLFHLKNVSAEPLLPGSVAVNGVPDGLFNKAFICGIRTMEPEPPAPDQVTDLIRRYAMYQAATFMVAGAAEFPKAVDVNMHTEILLKGRFFPLYDATVAVMGVAGKTWTQPIIWVNRDHMVALYLG